MAKNQHSPNSSGVCEKLYNATLRRISHNPKNSIPTPPPTAPHVSQVKAAAAAAARQQLPSSGEVIPIEFDPQLLPTVLQNPIIEGSFKLKMQDSMNDKFSDYISRVKNRMRSSSNVIGNPKISSRPDSFNDNVSNYIRRAQGKMRTSSTNVAAAGNSVDILGCK